MVYDIVIIGGGPAGSTMARIVDEKYKVLVVDKRNLTDSGDFSAQKCCGGLLAPDAQKVLAQFGLGVPKDVLVGRQLFTVRTEDFDNNIQKYYQRHYINVNREKFDRWLFSLIPSRVDIRDNCLFHQYTRKDDFFEVVISENGNRERIRTKNLVGADGATSKIRREAFEGFAQPEMYVSIQEWFQSDRELPHYVSVFDKDVTDFYSWIIQKDEGIIVGSAIKDSENAKDRFDRLINKLRENGYNLGEKTKREGTWIMRTRKIKQINLYADEVSLIGEAAGLISPSSAEGISYALRSGAMLADSMNRSTSDYGKLYQRKVRKLKINIVIKNLKAKVMYSKLLRMIVMKMGVLSMEIDKN